MTEVSLMDILILNGVVGFMMLVFVVVVGRQVNDITRTMDDNAQERKDARAKKAAEKR